MSVPKHQIILGSQKRSIKLQSVGACLYAEKLRVEKAYALPILFDRVWLHFQWGQLKTA